MDDKDKSQANAEADAEEAYVLSESEHEVLAPDDLDEEQTPGDRAAGDAAAGKAPETVDSMRDQLLRAMAETENVRRRAKKDVHDAAQYSISNFARDLLSVADNMSRALAAVTPELKQENEALTSIVDGVEMTARELDTVFERHRIKLVDPMGEPFDYNLHQAMFEDKESNQPDGTIVQVLQAGYVIGDRLLRPAMVGVAKGGIKPAAAESDDGNDENGADVGAKVDTSA
ncbi:MAG: nucleotide exchange factor GrpE [Alphaproteobacteria bacterium]|jgi:molecular chaperone GrpE|nr:nucleotide exchange factor GrpE [Alphaproteobacteria bacterium]